MGNATSIVRWAGRLLGSVVLSLAVLGAAAHPAAADVQLPPCVGGWTAAITDAPWLYAVAAVAANDVWAVGEVQVVAHWNGTAWHKQYLDNSLDGTLKGVGALAANDIWAVGGYSLAPGLDWGDSYHWNGSAWTHFDSDGDFGPLNAVAAVASNDVWAVGRRGAFGGAQAVHWNGSAWTAVAVPDPGSSGELFGVRAVSASDVWAAGYYRGSGGHAHTLIEHWNGTQWSTVPAPDPGTDGQLSAIAGADGTHLWAVGNYTSATGSVETLTLFWNGSAWSRMWNPSPGRNAHLYSATALARHDVWAVGSTEDWLTGQVQTLIMHWDGTAWSVSNSPSPGSTVNILYGVAAITAGDVWAVGRADQPYGGLTEHHYLACP